MNLRGVGTIALGLLCLAAGLRLSLRAWDFCASSLQLDLAAYVTAGEAVRLGLDPYLTHPDEEPPVWDGKSQFRHSRFLYPPLVAWLFAPLASIPYPVAKVLFTTLSLAALLGATLLLWHDSGRDDERPRFVQLLVLLALLLTAWPVVTLLERGQIDAFTLLLLVLAFRPLLRGRTPGLTSGALLALAVLLKLNAVYVAAFWALRRFWRGLAGLALGGLALLALSLVTDARALVTYLHMELPRIARFGENGTPAMRLPEATLARLRLGAPDGYVWRQGRLYLADTFGFVANASGARVLSRALRQAGGRVRAASMSLLLLAAALLATAVALGGEGRRATAPLDPDGELAYLSLALVSVLLAGPFSWSMNVVWMVTAGVLAGRLWPVRFSAEGGALGLLLLGLLLAWVPDQYEAPWLFAMRPDLGDYKYVAAEVLVLAAGAGLVRQRRRAGNL